MSLAAIRCIWYRLVCGLGRFSVVGTTVRQAEVPAHLLADEHHQPLDGQKVYIATTVADGCCLGAEPAATAGTDDLKAAYEVFKDEARDIAPEYAPKTVSTDGWKGTQAAWKALFQRVVILQCFLHAWLKIRDRAKHLKELFADVSRRVWEAFHAPDRRSFGQRLRWLRQWANRTPHGDRPGEGPRPVRQARAVVEGVPPSRGPPHERVQWQCQDSAGFLAFSRLEPR